MNRHSVVATKAITQSLSHCLKILYFWRRPCVRRRSGYALACRDDGATCVRRYLAIASDARANQRRILPFMDAMGRPRDWGDLSSERCKRCVGVMLGALETTVLKQDQRPDVAHRRACGARSRAARPLAF